MRCSEVFLIIKTFSTTTHQSSPNEGKNEVSFTYHLHFVTLTLLGNVKQKSTVDLLLLKKSSGLFFLIEKVIHGYSYTHTLNT